MRLLLVNQAGHRIGGIEVYLENLVPQLERRRHEVALLHQAPIPGGVPPLIGPDRPHWSVASEGPRNALEAVRGWRPDALYAQQLLEPALLGQLQSTWPSLYFAHCYLGVCVSTTKCWLAPRPRVCQRRLGWGCLLHYFPHRCGGLNPLTMWRSFQEQRGLQRLIADFGLVATHSSYVRDEYLRHGFPPEFIVKIPFWVRSDSPAPNIERARGPGPLRLLFLGRFDPRKGGGLLLRALPKLPAALGNAVHLTMAGDGPEGPAWRRLAARATNTSKEVQIDFPGWISGKARQMALASADLLVAPSVWPEPFGMTGVEAGFHAVPAVAFDVGGVREWLEDGVNGHLASAEPADVGSLSAAIVRALRDPAHYESLREGARRLSNRFEPAPHLDAIESLLTRCDAIHRSRQSTPRPVRMGSPHP